MRVSPLLKLFPAPKFLTMSHAGLDISDDAIRCLEYRLHPHGFHIEKHAFKELPKGLISGGEIKDEKSFQTILTEFVKANSLSYVKVSLPEEKTYLFLTEATSSKIPEINQNIEFKLEENVPIPPSEAIFSFDFLSPVPNESPRLSVSVVPKAYVEQYVRLLRTAGAMPISFEVVPKSIIRAIIPPGSTAIQMIVHIMAGKVGLYVISGTAVYFTSTTVLEDRKAVAENITKEMKRITTYWMTRSDSPAPITNVIVVGQKAADLEKDLHGKADENLPPIQVAEMWRNILDVNHYVPPVPKSEALEYAVAAGLALPI